MKRVNLSGMSVEGLMDLRRQVEQALVERKTMLEKELETLTGFADGERVRAPAALKGRKVPPRYRGPSGETWAGRGARPGWLVAAIKEGKEAR
jgi:DNA-binding protein H-NS